MDLGLKGCKALVAGASKGLGKACAKALIDEGTRVFICSRNAAELERTAAEINAVGYSAADVSLRVRSSAWSRRQSKCSVAWTYSLPKTADRPLDHLKRSATKTAIQSI